MPSTFEAVFASAAAPPLLSWLGVEAGYTPAGGDAQTVTVIVASHAGDEQPAEHGRQRRKTIQVVVPTTAEAAAGTPTGNYLAAIDRSATLTLDGESYTFTRVLAVGPLATLEFETRAAVEVTRPNYRRR